MADHAKSTNAPTSPTITPSVQRERECLLCPLVFIPKPSEEAKRVFREFRLSDLDKVHLDQRVSAGSEEREGDEAKGKKSQAGRRQHEGKRKQGME